MMALPGPASLAGELEEAGTSGPFGYWDIMSHDPCRNALSPQVDREHAGRPKLGFMGKNKKMRK